MEVLLTNEIAEAFPEITAFGSVGSTIATLKLIKPGKNADGYWTNRDLVEQTKLALIVFRVLHPNSKPVFAFDNSQNHRAMPPDGLVASRLNLSDGGKNVAHVRSGWYVSGGERVTQDMQFTNSHRKAPLAHFWDEPE
uniref:Uncharacterized protein n=1 Tax=Spongospora subterranea TaxID=70186 RepID=A0A0H5QWB7_9EUKA|eukprot:CRZ06210.1 hypothetical protein [Spongospora subterranea]